MMAWVAILAVLLGIEASFWRLLGGLPAAGIVSIGVASFLAIIAIGPFVGLTLLLAASPYGRRSPAALLTLFGGGLLATIALTSLASKAMWGYYVGLEWPLLFMIIAFVPMVSFLLFITEWRKNNGESPNKRLG
jgi:hypothetical protein